MLFFYPYRNEEPRPQSTTTLLAYYPWQTSPQHPPKNSNTSHLPKTRSKTNSSPSIRFTHYLIPLQSLHRTQQRDKTQSEPPTPPKTDPGHTSTHSHIRPYLKPPK